VSQSSLMLFACHLTSHYHFQVIRNILYFEVKVFIRNFYFRSQLTVHSFLSLVSKCILAWQSGTVVGKRIDSVSRVTKSSPCTPIICITREQGLFLSGVALYSRFWGIWGFGFQVGFYLGWNSCISREDTHKAWFWFTLICIIEYVTPKI